MSGTFKYRLEAYKGPSSRSRCPSCGHQRKFSKYVDATTGEILADEVGRCDREDKCGYHLTPKQYLEQNYFGSADKDSVVQPIETKSVSLLPFELMDKSVSQHQRADLYPFLSTLFGGQIATQICVDFFVGASKDGHTTFWQVSREGAIRQAKVINYLSTGKRNKAFGAVFAGKRILNDYEANLQQCFFGEYQLSLEENSEKPVAIVESEKTALIASVYFPELIWLATGGKNGARWTEAKVCHVLQGRTIILFPDLGAFDAWQAKANLIAKVAGCKVGVSDLLKNCASLEEQNEGLDIADYLLKNRDKSGIALTDEGYPVIWDYKKGIRWND